MLQKEYISLSDFEEGEGDPVEQIKPAFNPFKRAAGNLYCIRLVLALEMKEKYRKLKEEEDPRESQGSIQSLGASAVIYTKNKFGQNALDQRMENRGTFLGTDTSVSVKSGL